MGKLLRAKMPRFAAVALLLLYTGLGLPSAFAFDLSALMAATASTETANPLYVQGELGMQHQAKNFSMDWLLSFDSSGTYKAPYFGSYFGDFSVDIKQAELSYRQEGLSLILGQTPLEDIVGSPYSLFQNASGINALGAEIRYEKDGFFYRDRWISLNKSLRTTLYTNSSRDSGGVTEDLSIYDDRGVVLKTYGIQKGNFRLGFQDSIIFTGQDFDFYYFANPLPSIFAQYIAKAPGRPWSRSEGDHNTLMGFFADYEDGERYFYAQILVDDINMNRFLDPSGKQNPDKIAWSLGGQLRNSLGVFGLYHAGATKYTFESAVGKYYSYTLYPGSLVLWKGTESPIAVENTMLGYLHGENNLSLLATWSGEARKLDLGASLELSISGAKSPTNPWHEHDSLAEAGYGTRLLDDALKETKIVFSAEAGLPLDAFYLGVSGKLGYAFNRLTAKAVLISDEDGNAQPLFSPTGPSGLIGELSLFGRYILSP
jgi:hypothetical protein